MSHLFQVFSLSYHYTAAKLADELLPWRLAAAHCYSLAARSRVFLDVVCMRRDLVQSFCQKNLKSLQDEESLEAFGH